MARRFYNGAVRTLNVKVKSIPSNLVAGPLGFRVLDFFEIDDSERAAPNIEFDA